MVVGALPWDEIGKEVELATRHFSLYTHGSVKRFANIPCIVDWLMESPTPDLYPHITNCSWDAIEYRVTQGMRKLGWKKFARNIFVVPDIGQDAVAVAAGAEA